MAIRLNDEQCLLWIKDPSISPFENNRVPYKIRRNILSEANIKNPKSFLNRVKRKCFYNSAIRQQIVDKIKEYKENKTPRLYTLNDKLKNVEKIQLDSQYDKFENIEYITPPFTREECERWISNHLENPRPNETIKTTTLTPSTTKVYDKIKVCDPTYIELIYTTLQYGLRTPSILDTIPTDNNDNTLYNNANKIIKNVLYRLEFMKENDEYFLNHNVESFDNKLKITSSLTPIRKAAKAATNIAINPFGISSTTSKNLNSAEKRQLRDNILEKKEGEKSIAIYQYNKGLVKKKQSSSNNEIDNTRKDIFIKFKEFLINLQDKVINGDLVKNILENTTNTEDGKLLIYAIKKYIDKKTYSISEKDTILKINNYDSIEGILKNFINNMFAQIIDPATNKLPSSKLLDIGVLSYNNLTTNFKIFNDCELHNMILNKLNDISYFLSDKMLSEYFVFLTLDKIPANFVIKKKIEDRSMISIDFQNFYYTLLDAIYDDKPHVQRLPSGRGLLIGIELTKKVAELNIPYFNNLENQIITDVKDYNFTYKECKDWVTVPIFNPRTFKEILIDSPIYITLLVTSYQYDTKLIPRMITSHGKNIIIALTKVIKNIRIEERAVPQSQNELEEFIIKNNYFLLRKKEGKKENKFIPNIIGLKWKNAGTKQPKNGFEIIDKNFKAAFLNSTNKNGKLPFYVSFSEEDFAKFGITDIRKDSYIEISTYYIQAINNRNKSTNNLGLRWKIINNEKDKEGIKRKGFEIINKNLKDAFLKLANKGNVLPARVSFSKEDLVKYGITTIVPNNRYIKFTYYYKPVFEKSESDIKIKSNTNFMSKSRGPEYVAYKYYTVADCLRWARQPNKDPKTQDIILTDSKEYNRIFEQALIYDYNIIPINITAKGKQFMKVILKTIKKHLTIADKKNLAMSRGKDIADINSIVCNTINTIYDNENTNEGKKYKKFKDLMIDKCKKYNKDTFMCIINIRNAIEEYFYKDDNEYDLDYYQESALASLLNFYDKFKNRIYKNKYRDIFIYDFNKFRVNIYEIDDKLNETKKAAIDAGGPKREFFTKLFEELFCDDKHSTRPFACPADIIGNKYCINPNFKPDANFLKVIAVCNKKDPNIPKFKTERDYEYIYYVIGKVICLTVYNKVIGLPKQLSEYILAGFINQPNDFDYYDILYFYLKDYENAIPLLKMINKDRIDNIEESYLSFNFQYNISKTKGSSSDSLAGEKLNKDNCIKFLLQQANHVVTKNYLIKDEVNSTKSMKMRYESLFKGFSDEIRKFLYEKKVTIKQLSSLITNEELTETFLHQLVNKIDVEIPLYDDHYNLIIIDPIEKVNKENEMKQHISNMIIKRRDGVSIKEHLDFIKKLLQYWTALNYFNRNGEYNIIYKYGQGINVQKLPEAHTCSNAIDVYGFPNNYTAEQKDDFLYGKFKWAVEATEMELH